MATARKKELHPDGITTFVIDRNINYTNICWVDCKFCAFYRHEKDADAYVLTFDEIDAKIDELLEIGGTQILFQGGVHPKLKIEWYEDLVEHIHTKYPQITIHGNAGPGCAENMMSGTVRVKGFASVSAGASGHGGTLIIEGDAGSVNN